MRIFNEFLESAGRIELGFTVILLLIGASLAILVSQFNSKFAGTIVRALKSKKIRTADEACTVLELGLKRKFWYGFALRNRSALRRYIKIANEEEAIENGKVSLSKAKLYLPIELEDKAGVIYGEKDSNILLIIAVSVLLIAVGLLAAEVIPSIIVAMN